MMNLNTNNKRQSRVLNEMAVNVLQENKVSAILSREKNSYETIKQVKVDKQYVIDTTQAYSIPAILARLGYVSGSLVGIITNLIEVSGVLMDNHYNKQFLKEGTDNVDMLKLSKVFTCLNSNNGTVDGYDEIFVEVAGKVFIVSNTQGRSITLVKATKADIALFVNQLGSMRTATQEDLVKIGRDLEKIGRVMQELEIDSAKDASKKDGMMEITEFMSAYTCKLASKKMSIDVNFNEIIANHKAKNKKDIEFKYEIADFHKLDDAYDRAKQEFELVLQSNPQLSPEEIKMAKIETIRDCVDDAFILDAASEFKFALANEQYKFLNELVTLYKASDMKLFEVFKSIKIDAEESDINAVRNMAVVSIEMINNHFRYAKHLPMTKIDELATKLRNALYTFGEARGIEPKDTFTIACGAGWYTRTKHQGVEKIVIGDKYKYAAIAALFETELKWYFNADAMYTTIDIEIPDDYAINLDSAFNMENGECEVELEDGTIDYMFCEEENYTGVVICKLINGEPVFVKHINEYKYEPVEFMMFDKVCDLSLDSNKYVANNATQDILIAATKTISEVNTMNIPEEERNIVETREAERVGKIFKTWTNSVELSVSRPENFTLYSTKINNQLYINLRKTSDSQSRMLGRISAAVKSGKISDYTNMDTIVCAAGAITILN